MESSAEVLRRLHPGLQRWVRNCGWSGLSPVQRAAIPVLLDGRDGVVEAPTAGGKTEAVLFPSLTRAAAVAAEGVRILYLAPLRALLNNLEDRGESYAEACGLHAFKWHGDVSHRAKLDQLREPPELLMTTPESTEAILLRRARQGELFRNLQTVIVDEAHNFAAGDRGGHLLCLLQRLELAAERPPQRIALTATIGNPDKMLQWLSGGREVGQPIRVSGQPPPRDFQVRYFPDPEAAEAATGEQLAYRALHQLLPGSRSIVFVRSRRKAEEVAKNLTALDAGRARRLRLRTHHSAVSRFFREEAERLIKLRSEDGLDAVLSTSTLELGIDIGELDRVVQMGALASPGALLQRVGRTGRRAGKPQFFRGLLHREGDLPLLVATVTLTLEGRSEAIRFPGRAFHLLAHQLLCLSLQHHGIDARRAWEILRPADCFRNVRTPEVGELVQHMVKDGYLRWVDGVIVPGERSERSFLSANWRRLFAVFDSVPLYDVIHGREQVGTLDSAFAAVLEAPFLFVLAGQLWRAERIDHEARTIQASRSKAGMAPRWTGFGVPDIPFETAQRVGVLLHGEGKAPEFLDAPARETFGLLRRSAATTPWEPGVLCLDLGSSGQPRLLTYAGDRINRALADIFTLEGIGKTSASYGEVTLPREVRDDETLIARIEKVLADLRDGERGDPGRLAAELGKTLRQVPFSPFAGCLPPHLHAAALSEQTFDCEGLCQLMKQGELRIHRSG